MMKEINATFTKKQNLLRQQERITEMETMLVLLSLNVRMGSSEEIWPLTSRILHSFTVTRGSLP